MTAEQYAAARRSTMNAHYTSPEIAASMWELLTMNGWVGTRVWEPGCGIGIFAAAAPHRVQVTGIEIDPVTARLAERLHTPSGHTIINAAVEDVAPNGTFDAAIGNVPFADVRPYHPTANPNQELSLHNLAIRQAIRAVQPGSPVIVITSSFTLDNSSPAQRELLAAEGRFLGAVRLPETAFQAQSGTRVTTDIIAFQRLAPSDTADMDGWRNVTSLETLNGDTVTGNEWYATHPNLIIGELDTGGMYGNDSLRVVLPADALAEKLRAGIDHLNRIITERRRPFPDPTTKLDRPAVEPIMNPERPPWIKPGGIYRYDTGFRQRPIDDGPDKVYQPKPAKDRARLGHLVDLRDTYMALIEAEATNAADVDIAALRQELNQFYNQATRDGPLNEVKISTRVDGTEVRRRPPFGGMRSQDPDFATLTGLEDYNPDTGQATKAAVFTERQLHRTTPQTTVETPAEAVAVVLHRTGRLDRNDLAQLLNIDIAEVDTTVIGAAFPDPATGQLASRSSYLTGNVRAKLATATAAAADNDRYRPNVQALTDVLPASLEWEDIDVQLGVTWVQPHEIKAFIDETFDAPTDTITINYDPAIGWTMNAGNASNNTAEAFTETWGTKRAHALELIDAGLSNRAVKVYDTYTDGERTKRILNREETVLANQKLDEINIAFHEWLGGDPQRAQELTDRYNNLYRSHVAPAFKGDWPRPDGLASHIELRPHQNEAVERLLMTDSVGLYHAVGAGKTYTIATAAMELRRLGIAQKPALVVPNHLLTQFASEFQRAYPSAQLLIPDGRSPEQRRRFVGQCAAGDWDCVIIPQSMFIAIPVAGETEAEYIAARSDELRETLNHLQTTDRSSRSRTVKQVEKRIARLEERQKELIDRPRDPSVCFERTGIDALFVDEAHEYKNLEVVTSRQDLAVTPAQRATDLDMKLRVLRATHNRAPTIMATGTPLANSFHELWVMMRYTSPELLEQSGVDRFDAFCAQFGKVVTDYELSPTGWRLKDRFAQFRNVPELQNLFAQTADVKLPDDLDIPTPALETGKPQQITVPANPALAAYIGELEYRSNHLPDDPRQDNRLKILTDYRKAAIDLRLVDRDQPTPSKMTVAADGIAGRYHNEKSRTYTDPATGQVHANPGSLQIVFLDAGVPGPNKTDLYTDLQNELVERGVPADRISFIHDAKDPKPLFAACREGRVSVLVGSTQKMGTGMNVQTRATALWHIDPPWRPADIEQRNGRIERQGNQNPEVGIYHLIQEKSGDALSYQGLERKARMINAVLTNTNTSRTITAPDQDEITFGDLKALATGDPKVLELLRAKRELGELEIAQRSWQRRITRAKANIPHFTADIGDNERRLETLRSATTHQSTNPVEVTAARTVRPDQTNNAAIIDTLPRLGSTRPVTVAKAGHTPIAARTSNDPLKGPAIEFTIGEENPVELLTIARSEITPNSRIAARLGRAFTKLPELIATTQQQLDTAHSNLNHALNNSTGTFRQADELHTAQLNVAALEDAIETSNQEPPPAAANPQTPKTAATHPDPTRIAKTKRKSTPTPTRPNHRTTEPELRP